MGSTGHRWFVDPVLVVTHWSDRCTFQHFSRADRTIEIFEPELVAGTILGGQNALRGEMCGPRPASRDTSTGLDTRSAGVTAALPSARPSGHVNSGVGLFLWTWLPGEAVCLNLSGAQDSVF